MYPHAVSPIINVRLWCDVASVHVACCYQPRGCVCVCAYRYQCRQAAQQGCTYDNRMAAFCAMSAQLFVPIVFSKVGTGDGQVRDSWPATAVTVGFSHAKRVQTRVLVDTLFTSCVCCAAPCSFQCAAAECAGTPGCSFPVTPSADCSLPSMFQVMITGVVKPVRLAFVAAVRPATCHYRGSGWETLCGVGENGCLCFLPPSPTHH